MKSFPGATTPILSLSSESWGPHESFQIVQSSHGSTHSPGNALDHGEQLLCGVRVSSGQTPGRRHRTSHVQNLGQKPGPSARCPLSRLGLANSCMVMTAAHTVTLALCSGGWTAAQPLMSSLSSIEQELGRRVRVTPSRAKSLSSQGSLGRRVISFKVLGAP